MNCENCDQPLICHECGKDQYGEASEYRIVFDGPPGPESGRFIEVEDASRHSIRVGEWVAREDGSGWWELRISGRLDLSTTPILEQAEAPDLDALMEIAYVPGSDGR